MNNINRTIREIESIDELADRDQRVNKLHPLVKMLITILYIALTVSFDRYNFTGVLSMALYPFIMFQLSDLRFTDALFRLRIVLPLVCAVGIFNPFFDVRPVASLFGADISGGIVSMLTLMLKGILTVLASYLLIAATRMEMICRALRMLHIPRTIVTVFMLIWRYIFVFMSEADRITQAYSLRAPGQKGIAMSAWGTLAGQLLLRSIDRASEVYRSMCMRGFDGDFKYQDIKGLNMKDAAFLTVSSVLLIALRIFPVLDMIGNIFIYNG